MHFWHAPLKVPIKLTFPGATNLTTYWLSTADKSSRQIALNGKNITVVADGDEVPALAGVRCFLSLGNQPSLATRWRCGATID